MITLRVTLTGKSAFLSNAQQLAQMKKALEILGCTVEHGIRHGKFLVRSKQEPIRTFFLGDVNNQLGYASIQCDVELLEGITYE